ncbi:hypothetical protein GMA3_85 [Gordonia phage GMA3]|uniref:C2H2-type domain-containing protein n=1 Tax=Gordonia phage GMA3 TaxID=1647284 RepID=A0A0K0NL35_9CAUD|nr:hypothetical protein AU105_gp085 [Gordonia phage GMA3]AKL88262.1 hypothetical protein GMA3_85 [Gordonia phage GMA3]
MKVESQLRSAKKNGWDIQECGPFHYIEFRTPLEQEISTRLVLIGRAGWFCSECGKRVTVGNFSNHIWKAHGGYVPSKLH